MTNYDYAKSSSSIVESSVKGDKDGGGSQDSLKDKDIDKLISENSSISLLSDSSN